ncbi:MAG: septum site determining protein, partial [Nocardioides sp.]|nr:septum site determining protein [Nocardioides sp.]
MSSAPLIISRDAALVDELLRLAAAAGVTPDVLSETHALLHTWSTAGAVLVGADLAAEVAGAAPPRREGVHVVVPGDVADRMFRIALGVGAEHVVQLPHSEGWLVELLTDVGEGARQPAPTVGVIGGSGGAGATTFACALGETATRSGASLVVDLDPCGPGVD